MPNSKKASIDALMDKPLSKISASDFLTALGSSSFHAQMFRHWPEKKKYELHIEPENKVLDSIPLDQLLDKIKGEKKKAELEFMDFRDQLILPQGVYERLVNDITHRMKNGTRMVHDPTPQPN